jgi:hypothetical protein
MDVRNWSANKLQGGCWMLAGLLVLVYAFFDATYRYVFLVAGIALLLYGQRAFRKVETPFQRKQRELKRIQM